MVSIGRGGQRMEEMGMRLLEGPGELSSCVSDTASTGTKFGVYFGFMYEKHNCDCFRCTWRVVDQPAGSTPPACATFRHLQASTPVAGKGLHGPRIVCEGSALSGVPIVHWVGHGAVDERWKLMQAQRPPRAIQHNTKHTRDRTRRAIKSEKPVRFPS